MYVSKIILIIPKKQTGVNRNRSQSKMESKYIEH